MSTKTVTTDDLRRMNGKEGLVLQGCGGDPQEWLDGINGLLTDESILKKGSKFENISVFQNGSLTNILFQRQIKLALDIFNSLFLELRTLDFFALIEAKSFPPSRRF